MSEIPAALDRIEATYRVRYANQARVTRDPEELERMVAELAQLSAGSSPEAGRAATLRDTYQRELEQIRAARAVPYAVPAARLRAWTDLTRGRYLRSFAGRDRRTRDLGLLLDIVGDLERLQSGMRRLHESGPGLGLDRTAQALDEQVRIYRAEVEQIRASRRTGTQPEQGSRLANLANDQFALYVRMFANKPRVSRNAATLERIVGALQEIGREMQALRSAGFAEPNNDKNIAIVSDRVRAYGEELGAVRKARAEATVTQRAGALGAAANEVFENYRKNFTGKPRAEADPDLLTAIFEDLWPVVREMDEIDATEDDDGNVRNLQLVMDALSLYEREYQAIVAAKQAKP
jgi:hypothetical protein